MRKILIFIITILIIALVGQMAYYNFIFKYKNNENEGNNINNATQTNNIIVNGNNYNLENMAEDKNVIIPTNMEFIEEKYLGKVNIEKLEGEFYTFINTNVKKIYNLTTKKSINKILQMYDLNTSEINSMNIYSANDFLEITSQVFKVGNIDGVTYSSSIVDISSYNDEDKYTTFYVTFNYTNENYIKLKVYLANDSDTSPQIKFGADNEED